MKCLIWILLVSAAYATEIGITGGQIFVAKDDYENTNISFQAPGYSFTNVLTYGLFDTSIGWTSSCGGVCTDVGVGSAVLALGNVSGLLNGQGTEFVGFPIFLNTSFDFSSSAPEGNAVVIGLTGQARTSGWIQPCYPPGIDCGKDGYGPMFFFNPIQRWDFTAHFRTYPDLYGDDPTLYFFNDLTMVSTPVPELDSLFLTLSGLGGFGFFRLVRMRITRSTISRANVSSS